jgi:hypothetical protein
LGSVVNVGGRSRTGLTLSVLEGEGKVEDDGVRSASGDGLTLDDGSLERGDLVVNGSSAGEGGDRRDGEDGGAHLDGTWEDVVWRRERGTPRRFMRGLEWFDLRPCDALESLEREQVGDRLQSLVVNSRSLIVAMDSPLFFVLPRR